ncbi:tautomerase family protein [Asaia sp. As-1742]|uniref:tautomerase family protein n=1 Tax=Asaia sp. As-1742 TaxID=2608325 RepID=UPI00142023FC|nr:tautomerase family protein [Asaia sp. As-1742]
MTTSSDGGDRMPFAHIILSGSNIDERVKTSIRESVERLLIDILGNSPQFLSVVIQEIPCGDWHVGGHVQGFSAYAHVRVTEGRTTEEARAKFIAALYEALVILAGGALSEATYIVVEEMPANSWGFGGITQKIRKQMK